MEKTTIGKITTVEKTAFASKNITTIENITIGKTQRRR